MLLGLDLGTTNIKALVTDSEGQVVSSSAAPVKIKYLPNGGVEQDIEDIWSATCSAIAEGASACDASQIAAIGVSSQGGAMQIQTSDRQPVGAVISWLDARGKPYDQKMTDELGRDWFGQHTGHGRSGLTIGQLLRLKDTAALSRGVRVGFVGDVIVSRLCGRAAHDPTSLSLAMLYNPSLDGPDGDLLSRLGLSPDRLPDLMPATSPAGPLAAAAAEHASLPVGIPVSPAVHDQYAAALGCGAVNHGDVMFGAGTAWVLLAVTDKLPKPATDGAFVCRHPAAGLYGQILSLGNGGSAISWALSTLRLGEPDDTKIDEILLAAPPGSDGLRCRPLLADTGAASAGKTGGRLEGLRLSHKPAHILRAVVEGLACEVGRHLRMLTDAGMSVRRLLMCGPAAASSVTPQIISDITDLPVECLAVADMSAFGAAMVARSLVEPQIPLADISRAMAPAYRTVAPGSDRPFYAKLFDEY